MSDSKANEDDQDPDYAAPGPSDEAHQKLYEQTARSNVARKITAIVEKEFSKEIKTKEDEILQIEGRLHKALKTLHFLRYVVITDFYNRKQCQGAQSAGEAKQTRIHPAIKKIIGKAPKSTESLFRHTGTSLSETTKVPASPNETLRPSTESDDRLGSTEERSSEAIAPLEKTTRGKRFQEENSTENCDGEPARKIPRYVPPKSGIPEPQVPSRGARHKVRKRIVVGNISKWIPPDWREDAASHKWTMYVRGSKENPEIGDFVGKIRFFLHPSYRPNDVVEVTSPPFHLSRRGWGEFPLRVQLHFKNPLNKPMDIIHYLKLDRTYTGLQTLGSETVVDVWIKVGPEASSTCEARQTYEDREETESTKNLETLDAPLDSIKQEPPDNDKKSNSEFLKTGKSECCEKMKNAKEEKHEISHVQLEHDYANLPSENNARLFENENNFTISHSPSRRNSNDENTSLTSSSNNYPNNSTSVSEEIFDSSTSRSKSTENHYSRRSNGNCGGDVREFMTFPDNVGPEITIEASDASVAQKDRSESSNIQNAQDFKSTNPRLEFSSSKLQPLRIAIPAAFEALRRSAKTSGKPNKQILLMRDDKLIPVNSVKKTSQNIAPILSSIVSGVSTVNLPKSSGQRASVSLLKKPPSESSKNIMFTLSPANSLLLNSSNNIPALQIVDPTTLNTRRLYLVEKKTPHITNVGILSKKNKPRETGATEHWLDNYKLVTKPRITLGKDKIGITSKKDNYEEILRAIDDARITDVPALVRFIIRRVPLVTEKATDPEYRNLHPYASANEKEFLNSNVGKQRALEWYRAKRVKSFLKKKGIPDELQWSIKEIMIWSRLHGHTPIRFFPSVGFRSQNTTGGKSSQKNFPCEAAETSTCTITEPSGLLEFLRTAKETKMMEGGAKTSEDEIEIIDVENVTSANEEKGKCRIAAENKERKAMISLGVPEKIVALQSYVCDTTRKIGVKLEPEEIVPGVMHCAPARIMVKAVQCLLEDLLRSSLAKAWERSSDGSCPDTITLEDVRGAILNREEFDVFTNEGLGSQHCPDD